jgi:hypothetical protein
MPLLSRRSFVLPATLTTALLVGVAGPASAAPASDTQAAAKAATYLASQVTTAGTVVGSYSDDKGNTVTYTDWGRTLDAALGLLAAGGQDVTLGRALTSVETPEAVRAYTQGAPGDKADAAYVGATAKLAFVVAATGGDPTKVGGVNLITQLTSLQTAEGRFADRSSFGDYANVFGHSFALLALKSAGQTVPDALVQGLVGAQCPSGAFPETYPKPGTPCTGSIDATGLALQALAAVGQTSTTARDWLVSQQQANGSFPSQAPVNSTAYAVLGLNAVAASTGNALTYLASQQGSDGGLRTGAAGSTTSDVFATAQALPALAGKTFVESTRTVQRQAVLAVDETTITATGSTGMTVHAPANTVVDLLAYSRPSTTFRVVRTGTTDATGVVTFAVSPLTNTRLYVQPRGLAATPQVVVSVRTGLSLSASRTGVRTYAFSGRSIPARAGGLVISLYRVTATGAVLTAQTRADARTGNWSLTRAFSGTGTFGFVVRTGSDVQNVAGTSNTRTITLA